MKKIVVLSLLLAILLSGCRAIREGIKKGLESTPKSYSTIEATSESSQEQTEMPTPTPTAMPTMEPTPEPTEAPFDPSTIKTITKSGKGDDVIKIEPAYEWVYRITMTHSGSRNFAVISNSTEGRDLKINEIGKYSGSFVLVCNDTEPVTLEITANGKWTLKMEPLLYDGKIETSGKGSKVSGVFTSPGSYIVKIDNTGKSNFVVYLYTSQGFDLLVNEIGNYSGKKAIDIFDIGFWVVISDGSWSIKLAE